MRSSAQMSTVIWYVTKSVSLNQWMDYSISSFGKAKNHLQKKIIKLDPYIITQPKFIVDRLKNLMIKIYIILDSW